MWEIRFTTNALKDKKLLKESGLDKRVKALIDLIAHNPFQTPPSYEKLVGELKGYYLRRINIQHRIVYRVLKEQKIVIIHAMWTHYGK